MGIDNISPDEKPRHRVYLEAFWVDKFEVTNAMFDIFVQATGYRTDAEKEGWGLTLNTTQQEWEETPGADWRHPRGADIDSQAMAGYPVVQVSWNDAVAYCQWAGGRLPTEAEWEKAAAGLQGQAYPWGEAVEAGRQNFCDEQCSLPWKVQNTYKIDDGWALSAPTGSFPDGASLYGILDLAGNVWEWVQDWYSETYYTSSPASNPAGPASGEARVQRGGSWANVFDNSRAANRGYHKPAERSDYYGFRCAR